MSERHRRVTQLRRRIAVDGVAIVGGRIRLAGSRFTTHYTVGLTRHEGHPELIVVDHCCDCAETLLASVARLVRDGVRLGAGWGVQVQGFPFLAIDVDDACALPWAQRVYRMPGQPPIPALQLVATDEDGDFPWESGIGIETLLGPIPARLPGGW